MHLCLLNSRFIIALYTKHLSLPIKFGAAEAKWQQIVINKTQ